MVSIFQFVERTATPPLLPILRSRQQGELLALLLGDPALGTRLVSRDEFEASWENNVLFIIKSEADVGRKFFNTEKQWQHLASAPLGTAIGADDLASLTVNLPRLGEF